MLKLMKNEVVTGVLEVHQGHNAFVSCLAELGPVFGVP